MKLKDMCIVSLDKGEKKVKCYKFFHKELNRELAIHEDVDNKLKTSVSDVVTGFQLVGVNAKADQVKIEHVEERLNTFIKHYSLTVIEERFKIIEEQRKHECIEKS